MISGKKINVALVISNLGMGGAEGQVVEIANNLDRSQFNVHLFSLSSHVPLSYRIIDKDKRLHIVEKKTKYDITTVFRLAKKLKEYQIDIVHGFLFDAEIASRFAGKIAGCKVIGSERNSKNKKNKIQQIIYKNTSGLFDFCVANSCAGAQFHQSVCGLPSSSYKVVYNGVDTRRFCPSKNNRLRSQLEIRPRERVIGMFGSFKRQKNHKLLFGAAKRILQLQPAARFLIVGGMIHEGYKGTQSYTKELVDLISQLGIEKKFLFVGGQKHVEQYYNICDVTVLPSLYEGTPNVALESMACGVPLVATDVSDNKYVIPDGQVGYLVSLGDEKKLTDRIMKLLGDEVLRCTMGRRARNWAETEFSLVKMAQRMADVYMYAMKKGKS